jgi:hypothetical protein
VGIKLGVVVCGNNEGGTVAAGGTLGGVEDMKRATVKGGNNGIATGANVATGAIGGINGNIATGEMTGNWQ